MGNFNPKAALKLAQDARKNGDNEWAAKHYGELALYLNSKKKFTEAQSLYERAEKLSKNPRVKMVKVVLEHENGAYDKAKLTMSEVIESVIALNKLDAFSSYIEKDLKNYPKYKRQYYIKMLKLDRTSPLPFQGLARAEVEMNQPDEAIKIILKGLKTDPQDSVLIGLLSQAIKQSDNPATLAYLKRFEEGKINLEDLRLLISPKEKKEVIPLDTSTPESKELDTMIRELELVLGKRNDEDPDAVQPLVNEFRQKADKILGEDSQGRMDLALAFLEMGLYRESKEELKRIDSNHEDYPKSRCLLAETLMREGLVMECMEVLQSLLRTNELQDELKLDGLYKLMKVYCELGDYVEALEKAEEIESLQEGFRDVRELRQKLLTKSRKKSA